MACALLLDEDLGDNGSMQGKVPVGHLANMVPDWYKQPVSTGTTLLAVEYDNGVIIGADTRTSSGSFVVNRFADKLTQITDSIYCLRSGSAADTQAVARILRYQISFHEMETNEKPSVRVAANVLRGLCYKYRDNLLAGLIVAGWDKREKGQIYVVPVGGSLHKVPMATGGSGSSYVVGYLDSAYKPNMTREEAKQLVLNGVTLAITRDGASGGCVRLADISESGVVREDIAFPDQPRFFEG